MDGLLSTEIGGPLIAADKHQRPFSHQAQHTSTWIGAPPSRWASLMGARCSGRVPTHPTSVANSWEFITSLTTCGGFSPPKPQLLGSFEYGQNVRLQLISRAHKSGEILKKPDPQQYKPSKAPYLGRGKRVWDFYMDLVFGTFGVDTGKAAAYTPAERETANIPPGMQLLAPVCASQGRDVTFQ